MRIIFFGTPRFAMPSLQAIVDAGFVVPLVVTQPDRPVGRSGRPRPSAVAEVSRERGIPIERPERLRRDEPFRERLAAARPDAIAVVAYGKLLPDEILDLPPLGCLNVHASLLPRHRGASPIAAAILAGDRETGVVTMRIVPELDAGPLYLERKVSIGEREDAESLSGRLARVGAELLVETLRALEEGSLVPRPQAGEATFTRSIRREDARVDWRHRPTPAGLYSMARSLRGPGRGARQAPRARAGGDDRFRARPGDDLGRMGRTDGRGRERYGARSENGPASGASAGHGERVLEGPAFPPGPIRTGVLMAARPPSAARVHAVEILRQVLRRGAEVPPLLTVSERDLSGPDRDLLREIVLSALDSELASVSRAPLARLAPDLREILEVALYQIRRLDRVPTYAAVDEAVRHARASGGERAAKLVNAVLRRLADHAAPAARSATSAAELARETSHPEFLVRRWMERFGGETTCRILDADNAASGMDLLVNPRRTNRETLREGLAGEGVVTEPSSISPLGLSVVSGNPLGSRLLSEGHFTVQDVGAQALALLLPPGDLLVDLAAAPGGKSFAALAFGTTRRTISLDRSTIRLARFAGNARRLGMPEARAVAADFLGRSARTRRSAIGSIPAESRSSRGRSLGRSSPPQTCSRRGVTSSMRRAAWKRRKTSAWSPKCCRSDPSSRRCQSSRPSRSARSSRARGFVSFPMFAPTDSRRTCSAGVSSSAAVAALGNFHETQPVAASDIPAKTEERPVPLAVPLP